MIPLLRFRLDENDSNRIAATTALVGWSRMILAIGFSLAVARWFGAESRGQIAIIAAAVAIISQVADAGVPTAFRILVQEPGDSPIIDAYRWLAFRNGLLVWIVGLASYLLISPPRSIQSAVTLALASHAACEISSRYVSGALNAFGHFAASQLLQLTTTFLHVALLAAFVAFGRQGSDSVLLAFGIGSTISTAVHLVAFSRLVVSPSKPTRASQRSLSRLAVKSLVPNLALTLLLRSDQLIVGFVGGTQLLGQYAIAVSLSEIARPRAQAASQVILRQVAVARSSSDIHLRELGVGVVRVQLALMPLVVAASYWLAPILLGAEFQNLTTAVVVLLLAEFGFTACLFAIRSLLGAGQPGRAAVTAVFASAVGIASSSTLVPVYGLLGAAFGALLSYWSGGFIGILLAHHLFGRQ